MVKIQPLKSAERLNTVSQDTEWTSEIKGNGCPVKSYTVIKNDFLSEQILTPVLPLSSLLVAEHLIAQHSAIKMLHSRVKIILEYVKAVEAGEWNETKHVEKVWAQLFLNVMFPLNH